MRPMKLSVLVLTYRRNLELFACLESLERDGAPEKAEILVGLNDEPAANETLAALLKSKHPWVRILPLLRCSRGEARNRLAAAASGDVLYFLDDDTIVPPGFVERAASAFRLHPEAAAIGGPNVGPPGAAALPRAADFLLRSALGAGPMRIRHLKTGVERQAPSWAFTLSNMGVRRAAFESGFRFPVRAASAEETLFLHELARGGANDAPSPGALHLSSPPRRLEILPEPDVFLRPRPGADHARRAVLSPSCDPCPGRLLRRRRAAAPSPAAGSGRARRPLRGRLLIRSRAHGLDGARPRRGLSSRAVSLGPRRLRSGHGRRNPRGPRFRCRI